MEKEKKGRGKSREEEEEGKKAPGQWGQNCIQRRYLL